MEKTPGASSSLYVCGKTRQILVCGKRYANHSLTAQHRFTVPSTHMHIWFANHSACSCIRGFTFGRECWVSVTFPFYLPPNHPKEVSLQNKKVSNLMQMYTGCFNELPNPTLKPVHLQNFLSSPKTHKISASTISNGTQEYEQHVKPCFHINFMGLNSLN